MRAFTFVVFALALVVNGEVASPTKRPFTPLDLITFSRPSGFVSSTKGTHLVYFNSKYNATTNEKTNTVHLLNTVTGVEKDITELTTDDFSDPQFISDTKVVFVSSRSGSPQLWSYDFANQANAPIQHTNLTVSEMNGPKYNPTTKQLIFSSGVLINSENKPEDSFSSGTIYDRSHFRQWDSWYDYVNQHIHITQLEEGKFATEARDLLVESPRLESPRRDSLSDPNEYAISNDGKYVAFVTDPDSKDVAFVYKTELYLVPTQGQPKLKLVSDPNICIISNVRFSPDSKFLAYLVMKTPKRITDKNVIILHDLITDKKLEYVADWDQSPSSFEFSSDGKSVYLMVSENAQGKVFQLDLNTKKRKEIVKEGSNSVLAEYEDNILITRSRATHPTEVYSVKKEGFQLKPVTKINTEAMSQVQLSSLEEFYFTGAKNEKVQGWLMKPINFDPTKKYPVMLWIHGGPEGDHADIWSNRWNYQIPASAGYVLVTINFHGSVGFGQGFTDSVLQNWGTYAYEDIMKGLNYLLRKHCFLDGNRIAAWGGSFGGYMVNYLNGKTNRFKALVNFNGLFDLKSDYYTTDIPVTSEDAFDGVPYQNPNLYEKFSPATYLKNWKTPMYVIHGGKDYRVDQSHAISTFTALQRLDVPSKFLYFKDENHRISKNANSLLAIKESLKWSAQWLNHTMPYQL